MTVPEFNPTKLGTKQFWDDTYEEELHNFEEMGDEGEVWFGIETVQKMVDWSLEHIPPSSKPTILEVGCGNGTLLLGLLEAGYDGSTLHGIDYSEGAVKLASAVAAARGGSNMMISKCDFLLEDPPLPHQENGSAACQWDLIMDKGTYDAIALGKKDSSGHSPAIHYPGRVVRLLKPGGIFLITSCNFTEEELQENFISESTGFVYHSRIQHPVYTYGGKSGSICSSIALRRT